MQSRLSPPSVLVLSGERDAAALIAEHIDAHFGGACASRCLSLEALAHVSLHGIDIVLCDDTLPDGDAFTALGALLARREGIPVVVLTREHDAARAAEAIRLGAVDYALRTGDYLAVLPIVVEKNLEAERVRAENRRLHGALSSSLAELKRKNRELADAAARFEALAATDPLTGLANRRRLKDQLHVMFSEAVRYGHDLSCLMIDLDGFKNINDAMGHQAGDEVLILAGRVVDEQIRSSDLGARYGGDEFVVALPHTSSETAAALGHRLRSSFKRRALTLRAVNSRFGMSIGVASLRESRPMDLHQLIAHADMALYAAKAPGSSGVMISNPDGKTARETEAFSADPGAERRAS